VNDLVKPSDDTLNLVHEWLVANGIENLHYTAAHDWIQVLVPVETAERLLDTQYYVFEHEDGTRVTRTPKWSLPLHLHDHIDAIQPTTSFFRARAQGTEYVELEPWTDPNYTPPSNATISAVCNITMVSPECFMNLYSTKGYVPKASGNQIAFNNFLGEIPIRPDTSQFLSIYRSEAVSAAASFKQISIADGPVQDGPLTPEQAESGISMEANLDVQAISAISYPVPITSFSTGGSPPFNPDLNTPTDTNEPYLVWVNYIMGLEKVPQIISTSYGDDEQTVPKDYAERVCKEFARLGARGVSLLFASGDAGVGAGQGDCKTNDGKNITAFMPSFPAGCPYVTTVGATHEFEPEVVAFRPARDLPDGTRTNPYSSGGGFSNYFSAPRYQKRTVKAYIEGLAGKYDGLYNKGGRGYPDIAAQGQFFAYVWNGTVGSISGTSASTPLMSGILSLVNDALLSSGKPVLGFLNPWLYRKGFKGFTDIVNGSAVGCDVDGFPATKGWDPVTGFGTPIFPVLTELAKAHKSGKTNGLSVRTV
jgi:tripeptidyl-peptidase I